MPIYEFAITVSGIDPFGEGKIDELYESGFDDAAISSCAGRIIFDFSKESPSMSEAVMKAVVLLTSIGAKVVEIEEGTGLDDGVIDDVRKLEAAAREIDQEAFEDAAFGYSPTIAMQRRRTDAIAKARDVLKAYVGREASEGNFRIDRQEIDL